MRIASGAALSSLAASEPSGGGASPGLQCSHAASHTTSARAGGARSASNRRTCGGFVADLRGGLGGLVGWTRGVE